jgi:hypothetical protein
MQVRRIALLIMTALGVVCAWHAPGWSAAGSKVNSGYADSLVIGLASTSGIPTVVRGAVATVSDPALGDRVRSTLRLPGYFAAGSRFGGLSGDPTKGLRLVLIVNLDNPAQAGQRICGDVSGVALGGNVGRFVLIGAFCRDGSILSEVDIRESAVAGVEDPRFQRYLDTATTLLFPSGLRVSPNN